MRSGVGRLRGLWTDGWPKRTKSVESMRSAASAPAVPWTARGNDVRSQRVWCVVAMVLGGALVAGCSDRGDPPPATSSSSGSVSSTTSSPSSSSPSPSRTSSPSSSATVAVPPAATKKTPEGAEAFAKFYTEQLDSAAATSRTATLKGLSMKSCSTCQEFIRLLDDRASRSEHGERTSFKLGAIQMDSGSPANEPVVNVLVTDAGSKIVNGAGTVVETSTAAKLDFRYTLKWVGSAWRVARAEIVQ